MHALLPAILLGKCGAKFELAMRHDCGGLKLLTFALQTVPNMQLAPVKDETRQDHGNLPLTQQRKRVLITIIIRFARFNEPNSEAMIACDCIRINKPETVFGATTAHLQRIQRSSGG
jgi:hypothetical protein